MKSVFEAKITNSLSYPCVRMHNDGDFAILFSGHTTGMIIWSQAKDRRVGEYAIDWTPADATGTWKPLNGRIVLEG